MNAYEKWAFEQLLARLEAAGFALVKKPELLHKGIPGTHRR